MPPVATWKYRGRGQCEYCQDGNALLYTPTFPDHNLRVASPPLFCNRCMRRFDGVLRDSGLSPDEVLVSMRQEGDGRR
jgi:hypothetical protein